VRVDHGGSFSAPLSGAVHDEIGHAGGMAGKPRAFPGVEPENRELDGRAPTPDLRDVGGGFATGNEGRVNGAGAPPMIAARGIAPVALTVVLALLATVMWWSPADAEAGGSTRQEVQSLSDRPAYDGKGQLWRGKTPRFCAVSACVQREPTFCLVGRSGARLLRGLRRDPCDVSQTIRTARELPVSARDRL